MNVVTRRGSSNEDEKKLLEVSSPPKRHIGEIGKLDTKKQRNDDSDKLLKYEAAKF